MPAKTDAQKAAQRRYMASVATIQIRTTPDQRNAIRAHAQARGESVNAFVNRAIQQTMKMDKGVI